jgi:hypothetical protein
MWFFFSVCVFCGMITYLARRAEPLLRARLTPAPEPVQDQPAVVEAEPIPVDLMNLALQESEEWARQGVIRAMLDMYERCRNWDVVRAAYSAHPIDLQ